MPQTLSELYPDCRHGYEYAHAVRLAAHPEVASTLEGQRPVTFEEYSLFYNLSSSEPLGSRVDEYADHFMLSVKLTGVGPDISNELVTAEANLDRVAILIGAQTFRQWLHAPAVLPNDINQGLVSTIKGWLSIYTAPPKYVNYQSMWAYKQYVLTEACAYIWHPHVLSLGPFGPSLLHFTLRNKGPRFLLPTQSQFVPQLPDLQSSYFAARHGRGRSLPDLPRPCHDWRNTHGPGLRGR